MKALYLSQRADVISDQLCSPQSGAVHTLSSAKPLRDDVSTDEITPVAILSYYDDTLGEFAHTGLTCEGEKPIARGALKQLGATILVAGHRYGKGSSREHSPTAEMLAGIRLVFAKSFERIYRQNADNIGLWTSTNFALLARIETGEFFQLEELVPYLIAEREPLAASILQAGGLLPWGQQHLRVQTPNTLGMQNGQPQTLAEKILHRHLLTAPATACEPIAGEGVFVSANWRFIHEYYCGMADTLLRKALGSTHALQSKQSIVVFEDHSSYVEESPAHIKNGLIAQMLAMSAAQRRFVKQHDLRMHRTLTDAQAAIEGKQHVAGISHAMMAEHYALPGQIVVGTDSHTPHSGALGCLAFGVGTTDMANAFVSDAVRVTWPQSVKVNLTGRMPQGVTAKDLVLHLLSQAFIRAGGGVGKVFEFAGEAVASLSIDERATLTNMTAELGGLTGIVAPDAQTQQFLRERRGIDFAIEPWMHSDEQAVYDHTLSIDCAALSPMLARPGDPGNGIALADLGETIKIDIAYGGSCTAGKREDFDHYHAVLAWGLAKGLRIPAHVQVFLQYGTTAVRDYCVSKNYDKTFASLGVRILQPSCGACANCGPGSSIEPSQVTVSAINRNFPGRSGPGQVWLASPPTVMASALAGKLISWDELKRAY